LHRRAALAYFELAGDLFVLEGGRKLQGLVQVKARAQAHRVRGLREASPDRRGPPSPARTAWLSACLNEIPRWSRDCSQLGGDIGIQRYRGPHAGIIAYSQVLS
jgi:hypothetical protein